MIEQSVRIHDRHQVELKLAYRLGDFPKAKVYDLSLFFFVPASLGITPSTYSKRDFFNDLISHVRIKTPAYLLRDLSSGPDAPLKKLEASLTRFAQQPSPHSRAEYERQLKMLCCIVKSSLRDHVAALGTRNAATDRRDLVEQFLVGASETCKAFRALRRLVNVPTVGKEDFTLFLLADEFLSLTVEAYAYELAEAVKPHADGPLSILIGHLVQLAGGEVVYRAAQGYPSLPDASGDNETVVFRKSVLKKFAESVLFLGVRAAREGTLIEHGLFAVAAGLSMVFATGVAFLFQRSFGNLTFPVFVALVVSYMLKDRIKELLRIFLATKARHYFSDRRLQVFNGASPSEPIGTCRESFDFVKDRQMLASVERLRNRDHLTEIENGWVGETVFLYRKRITLLPRWFKRARLESRSEGINDILRMNFSHFLVRMDDPNKAIWFNDGVSYRQVNGQRVYHVNLIVRCQSDGELDESRFRIVLNKEGVKRIEAVGSEHVTLPVEPSKPHDDGFAPTGSDN